MWNSDVPWSRSHFWTIEHQRALFVLAEQHVFLWVDPCVQASGEPHVFSCDYVCVVWSFFGCFAHIWDMCFLIVATQKNMPKSVKPGVKGYVRHLWGLLFIEHVRHVPSIVHSIHICPIIFPWFPHDFPMIFPYFPINFISFLEETHPQLPWCFAGHGLRSGKSLTKSWPPASSPGPLSPVFGFFWGGLHDICILYY